MVEGVLDWTASVMDLLIVLMAVMRNTALMGVNLRWISYIIY